MSFRLIIKNFQSIPYAEIDIHGFTTIVGPSNLGKSALVRALRAWAYNELHPSFIRDGEKVCELTGVWSDDTPHNIKSITFVKSSSQNAYTVTFKDGTTKPYPKIGTDVPDELKQLNYELLVTEREDQYNLNFQAQLESLFLVADTPTELTSFLNKIFGIAKYESALRSINSDQIKLQREYDDLSLDTVRLKKKLEDSLAEQADHVARQESFEALWGQITKIERRIEALTAGIETAHAVTSLSAKRDQLQSSRATLQAIPPMLSELTTVARRAYSLGNHIGHFKSLQQRLVKVQVSHQQYLPANEAVGTLRELFAPYLARSKFAAEYRNVAARNQALITTLAPIQAAQQLVTEYRKQLSGYSTKTAFTLQIGAKQATLDKLVPQREKLQSVLPLVQSVSQQIQRVGSLQYQMGSLATLHQKQQGLEADLASDQATVKELEDYRQVFSGVECPLCHQSFDSSKAYVHA